VNQLQYLSPEEPFLLRHEGLRLFDCFDRMGHFFVRANNHAVLMEKRTLAQNPVTLGESGNAVLPEAGLTFSLKKTVAAHAILRTHPRPLIWMELDLVNQPNGLSFGACPETPAGQIFSQWMDDHSIHSVDRETLASWRAELHPKLRMDDDCIDASTRRASQPTQFPVYRVLEHAKNESIPLRFRLLSRSVDLVGQTTPEGLSTHHSWICAESSAMAFHLDTFFADALRLHPVRLDGETYTCLSGYNALGTEIFEISTTVNVRREWESLCRLTPSG
jgi:hypothetical protein